MVAQMDVDNAFYRLKCPAGVDEHFVLPPVDVWQLRKIAPELCEGIVERVVSPRLMVLAMGWSWSLFFSAR